MTIRVLLYFSILLFYAACQSAQEKPLTVPAGINSESSVKIEICDGIRSEYRADGSLCCRGETDGEMKKGRWTQYYENGTSVKNTGEYINDAKNAEWIEFSPDGSLVSRTLYSNGDIKEVITFHENGTPNTHSYYKNGKIEGKYQEYDSEGKSTDIAWFRNGFRDGKTNLWYPNGKRKASGDYSGGIKSGKWIYYHENGFFHSKGTYTDDKKNDDWIYYDTEGRIIDAEPETP